MTLKIIEKLNMNDIKCTVLTKGQHSKKLINDKYSKDNVYGITLVSLDKKFKQEYEPNSAPFSRRVKALKFLHKHGLKTWASIEPYPTPNIVEQDLTKILEKVVFVDKIIFGRLNYNVKSTGFKNNKQFYEKQAEEVIEFCREKGMEYHIKYGTNGQDNKKTSMIFV